jgi:hypothetical protein
LFFLVGVAGFIGWLTIGGTLFVVAIAIGVVGGTAAKARDE